MFQKRVNNICRIVVGQLVGKEKSTQGVENSDFRGHIMEFSPWSHISASDIVAP